MNKITIIMMLVINTLFAANALDISKVETFEDMKSYSLCIFDAQEKLSFEDILHSKDLKPSTKTNLGYKKGAYWCKFEAFNSAEKEKSLIFSNPRPGMDYIDVVVYKEGKKAQEFHLGDMNDGKNRSYKSVFSNFELSLQAGESSVLITRYKSVGTLECSWIAHTLKDFFSHNATNTIIIFSFFGFFLAMMIYKIFIYFHIRDKEYLIYALALASIIISQASLQGTMHYFFYGLIDTFTITLWCWNITHLFLVFLWLFTFYFFDITKKSRFYYPLVLVIYYNIFITLFYTLAYVWVDVLLVTPLITLIALVESLALLGFSVVMFFQKKAGSGYFLIGHFLYILAVFVYILNINGTIAFSLLAHHSTAIGLFLVILFMSLALSRKFKVLKDENKEQKKVIENNKLYTMIGTTIAYVSHQWKQPLSILSSQTTNLQSIIDHEPSKPILQVKNKIDALEDSISYINATLDNIKGLFLSQKNEKTQIKIMEAFEKSMKAFEQKIKQQNINVSMNINENITILGNENLLIHAVSNIIHNAIEAFEPTQKQKNITIKGTKETNSIVIRIEDNAGGIALEPIEKVFEPHVTNKPFGSGIGLAFSKNIIESRFRGSIEVKSLEQGSCFMIRLYM